MQQSYADFNFYSSKYLGNKINTETEFQRYALRASRFMDLVTFNRLSGNLPSDEDGQYQIQYACCALAEDIQEIESIRSQSGSRSSSGGDYIKSLSSGGESVTYGQSALTQAAMGDQTAVSRYLNARAKTYLSGVSDDQGHCYLYGGLD